MKENYEKRTTIFELLNPNMMSQFFQSIQKNISKIVYFSERSMVTIFTSRYLLLDLHKYRISCVFTIY